MGIRFYKPTTPGRRGASVSDFAEITDRKKKPEKKLVVPKKKKGGRNFQGVVVSRFRGGGHKQMYRIIDFKRQKDGVFATVESIESRTLMVACLRGRDQWMFATVPLGSCQRRTIFASIFQSSKESLFCQRLTHPAICASVKIGVWEVAE